MSDEEDDYMSDAFLKDCKDTRPGLVSKRVALEYERENKKKIRLENKPKSKSVLEIETRTEGLQTALKSDNKGFALLQKMGYKPGMAIGKRGVGRTEPVPIQVKANRGGLGQEAERKRKSEAWNNARASVAARRKKFEERTRGEFMERLNSQFVDRRNGSDLMKSQNVCEQLDSEQEITVPAESFFWSFNIKDTLDEASEDKDEEEKDEEEDKDQEDKEDQIDQNYLTTSEKLEFLTEYLRERHLYCIWCGIKFEDFTDMETNCPGNTYNAHND